MRNAALLSAFLLATLLPACGSAEKNDAAREWQRNECNQIIDGAARERCMKRVDAEYGKGR